MTVTLSVHDVREHIRRASEPSMTALIQASSPLLGRIFHAVAADLASSDPLKNAFSFLETLDFDKDVWRSHLAPHTYDNLLGPRLTRDAARLQVASSGVLHLWEAVQAFCEWMVDLAWVARNPEGRKRALSWEHLRVALQAEVPLEAEFLSAGWSERASHRHCRFPLEAAALTQVVRSRIQARPHLS